MFWRGREGALERPIPVDGDSRAVSRARRDPRQFEPLYRKYVAQIYSFALYELRDHHAAEDLTEQVFLRALAGLPRFEDRGVDGGSSFRVWLFQICRNLLSNERRREARHPEAPLELAWGLAGAPDPALAVERRDEALRAWDAVARLSPERRRALVLRFVEEMSAREIGEVLGRSEGASRLLVHRALRAVAADLRSRS